MSNKKAKYVSLPLKRKCEIACKLSKENVNMSKLVIDLGVPRTTIINLRKSKDKIIPKFEAGHNCKQKRKRKHGFDDVDAPLLKWFCSARNERIPVSSEMLLLKARQFASVYGHDNADKLDQLVEITKRSCIQEITRRSSVSWWTKFGQSAENSTSYSFKRFRRRTDV